MAASAATPRSRNIPSRWRLTYALELVAMAKDGTAANRVLGLPQILAPLPEGVDHSGMGERRWIMPNRGQERLGPQGFRNAVSPAPGQVVPVRRHRWASIPSSGSEKM